MKPSSPPALRLFGEPHLLHREAARPLPGSLPGLLLAYLAIRGEPVAREALSGLLFPDDPPDGAARKLRVTLHRARQWLAEAELAEALEADRHSLRLRLDCDVGLLRDAVAEGCWADAEALHRAPLLAGWPAPASQPMADALAQEREALAAAARAAGRRLAQQLDDQGMPLEAAAALQRQLDQDVLDEDAVQWLLRLAQRAAGPASTVAVCRAAALDAYRRFAQAAQRALGVTPLPETEALARALSGAPGPVSTSAAGVPSSPAGGPGRDAPAVADALADTQADTLADTLAGALADPPLVARPERALAEAALARGARLVLLQGEPGIGKTRLAAALRPPGAGVLWLRARAVDAGAPWAALAEALRQEAPRLASRVPQGRDGQILVAWLPALARGPDAAVAVPDAALHDVLEQTLARWLPQVARTWVVDDLQWLDGATRQLLARLWHEHGDAAPQVLATLRSGEAGTELLAWLDAHDGPRDAEGSALHDAAAPADGAAPPPRATVTLAPLPAEALAVLVAQLAGGPVPGFAAWLHHRCGGNPLFALETLREAARLARGEVAHGAAWAPALERLAAAPHALQLPARISALVRQRLERLGEVARRVLMVSALAGDAEHGEALADVAGVSPWAVALALAQGETAGLLRGTGFAHDVVRESLAALLPEPARRMAQRALLRRMAGLWSPARLAALAWACGDSAAAVAHTLAASQVEHDFGLLAAAQATLAEARARLGDAAALAPLRARLDAQAATQALVAPGKQGARALAERALASLPDPQTRRLALVALADVAISEGHLDDAGRHLHEAAPLPGVGDDDFLAVRTRWHYVMSRFDEAAADCRERAAQLRQAPPSAGLASTLRDLCAILFAQGQLDEAAAVGEEAMALARQLHAPHIEQVAANNMVAVLGRSGRTEEALALAEQALPLGRFGHTDALRSNIIALAARLGHLERALAQAEAMEREAQDEEVRGIGRGFHVDLLARLGRVDEARALIDRWWTWAESHQIPRVRAHFAVVVFRHGHHDLVRRAAMWVDDSQPLDGATRDAFTKAREERARREAGEATAQALAS